MLLFPTLSHSQLAYVTTDLDEALDRADRAYGLSRHYRFNTAEQPTHPNQPALKIALARIAGVEFEFIQPLGFNDSVYSSALPSDGRFALMFHHIAFRVGGTLADYDEYRAGVDTAAHPIVVEGWHGEDARWFYTDERATLGHYIEHVWFSAHLSAIMQDAVPDQLVQRRGG